MQTWNFATVAQRLEDKGILFNRLTHTPLFTMEDVKKILNVPEQSMAKTLVIASEGGSLVAAVLPGSKKLHYAALAKVLGIKRRVLRIADTSQLQNSGLVVGAISPFAGAFTRVVVDPSLLTQTVIYCGSGDYDKTIAASPKDLVSATSATVAEISV